MSAYNELKKKVSELQERKRATEELRELDCIDSPTLRGAAKQEVKRVLWRGGLKDGTHEWLVLFLADPNNPRGIDYGLLLRVKEGWVWCAGRSSDIYKFVSKYQRSQITEQWPTIVE